jgi:hypothetical protein
MTEVNVPQARQAQHGHMVCTIIPIQVLTEAPAAPLV